jgi:Ca-activated chloride channel family protein
MELIHPGERIDEKVTAQFARAVAPRIEEVSVTFDGVDVQELSPAPLPPLVDGEPWVLFGRYTRGGRGRAELRGVRHEKSGPQAFALSVEVMFPEQADAPHLAKLWARERIRDLERAHLTGRRSEANKERITKLAIEHQLVTELTSFLVVEHRTADRLSSGQPQTRVIPVNFPAGWDMFKQPLRLRRMSLAAMAPPAAVGLRSALTLRASAAEATFNEGAPAVNAVGLSIAEPRAEYESRSTRDRSVAPEPAWADPVTVVLQRQLASGLWEPSGGGDGAAQAVATARALLELLEHGITTSHATHGAQVRKAVASLAALLLKIAHVDAAAAEFAASVAWLVATGPRSRAQLEDVLKNDQRLKSLRSSFDDEAALRKRVEGLSDRFR